MANKRIYKKLSIDEIVDRLHALNDQIDKELGEQEEAMLRRHKRLHREVDLLGNQINRIIKENKQ